MGMRSLSVMILIFSIIGCDNPLREVFTNYGERKDELQKTVEYFASIKPPNLKLYIRFDTESRIDLKLDQADYWNKSSWDSVSLFNQYGQYHRFNVDVSDTSLLEVFRLLQLDKEKISTLHESLSKASCNSISNNFSFSDDFKVSFTSIGYQTNEMYALYYLIFEQDIERAMIDKIVQACNYKEINNNALVEYGGPAFGSNCFPDK